MIDLKQIYKSISKICRNTKQVKAASVLNNAFDSNFTFGDGKELCATDHPTAGGGNLETS